MNKLIGILEDDQGIRDILEFLLSEEGYEVECYTTVNNFLTKKDSSPDLFILDVMLPDGNGLEVCKILKSSPKTSATPVIMMSAHADMQQMNSGCRAEEFVKKPFDIFAMLEKIVQLLNKGNPTTH
ncbi:response regulator transcription factor [Pedobacter alluvionis]|uniref:Response regulator receiver domain-containing protein n=1 Tax=Pedobacter alluvionis TaxID=475253 RepID=A0A497XVY3_9SPHI|nr:response regulator transcription factor [Pedobacter alluvionis]RLJ72602.1 response regulator receiver domain-containing protein [Pedobacter alluvionis]TFB28085.1 response regulator transcription factor [Pedobacter alluvionis]